MNHKRGNPKSARSGCLLCQSHKLNAHKTAQRMKDRRDAFKVERNAW